MRFILNLEIKIPAYIGWLPLQIYTQNIMTRNPIAQIYVATRQPYIAISISSRYGNTELESIVSCIG